MNKNDLIDAVTERTSLAKSDAARAVEAVLGSITEALQKGDAVALSGFGTFADQERALPARAAIRAPASRSTFRPARCPASRLERASRMP